MQPYPFFSKIILFTLFGEKLFCDFHREISGENDCKLLVSSYGHLAWVKRSFDMSESFSLGHFGWTRGTSPGHFFGKACMFDTIEVSGASPPILAAPAFTMQHKGEKK